MELASMLAGEPFSDHPKAVCPVIGVFLRAYNDALDDTRRQDLYAYAAKVVGSRVSAAVEEEREAQMIEWTMALRRERRRWPFLPRRLQQLSYGGSVEGVATCAAREAVQHGDAGHGLALALIDQLLAIGGSESQGAASDRAEAHPPVVAPA